MWAIRDVAGRHGLKTLEDAAQACGGRYRGRMLGTWGDAAAFSFFPSKTLGALGDAGLIATDDGRLADCARMLRAHGARRKHESEAIGYSARLDEIQAAVLRVKLPHLDERNAARRRRAAQYTANLGDLPPLVPPSEAEDAEHVYHQYTVRIPAEHRDAVRQAMAAAGVQTAVYYPVPLHKLPVYSAGESRLPAAEAAAREVLSLPIWPRIDTAVQDRVTSALRAAIAAQ